MHDYFNTTTTKKKSHQSEKSFIEPSHNIFVIRFSVNHQRGFSLFFGITYHHVSKDRAIMEIFHHLTIKCNMMIAPILIMKMDGKLQCDEYTPPAHTD